MVAQKMQHRMILGLVGLVYISEFAMRLSVSQPGIVVVDSGSGLRNAAAEAHLG
jgi:hypothetical protein